MILEQQFSRTLLKGIILLLCLAHFINFTSAISCPNGTDTVAIQLGWVFQAQYAGFIAAKEMGYFENECLNVVIKQGGAGVDPIENIKSGSAQFAVILFSRMLVARAIDGVHLVDVFQHFKRAATVMVSTKKSAITKFTQFKDKNIGYWSGYEYSLKATMRKYGISPETELSLREQSYSALPLITQPDRYDVIMAMTYNELAQLLEKLKGQSKSDLYTLNDFNVMGFNDEGTQMYEDGLMMNMDWYNSNPSKNRNIVIRLLKSIIMGWIFCRDNEDKCLSVLPDQSFHQQWMLREVNSLVWPAEAAGMGFVNSSLAQQSIDISTQFHIIPNASYGIGAYTNEFVEQAYSLLSAEIATGKLSSTFSDYSALSYIHQRVNFCYDQVKETVFICTGKVDNTVVIIAVLISVLGVALIIGVLIILGIACGWRSHIRKRNKVIAYAPTAKDGEFPIIFTDIQESTKLWSDATEDMKLSLNLHNVLLRRLLEEYQGYEIKTQGDSFMVAFKDHLNSIKWMLRSQIELVKIDWPTNIMNFKETSFKVDKFGNILFRGVRVRMGGAMCHPDVHKDNVGKLDYFGNSVNLSARVASAANGGQIIIHQNIYDIIKDNLHELIVTGEIMPPILRELGSFSLKGIDGDQPLYELLPYSLRERSNEFPPVSTGIKGHMTFKSKSATYLSESDGVSASTPSCGGYETSTDEDSQDIA